MPKRNAKLYRLWRKILLSTAVLVLITAGFEASRRTVEARLLTEAHSIALSRVQTLESILAVQRAVASTLADDDLARRVLRQKDTQLAERVSAKLERLRHETGSTIIYLIDTEGLTISASNWREPISFVGGNYAFRSYFQKALTQGTALEYALGKDSGAAGLYLSHSVHDGEDLLGVVVVKMVFDTMEEAWARGDDLSYVADEAARVVLASDPNLRFGPPPPVGHRLSVTETVTGAPHWQLTLLTSATPALQAGLLGAFVAAALAALLIAFHRRRLRILEAKRLVRQAALQHQHELERAVDDRTRALKAEVEERKAAEERLARMQGDLVQANKLATLGQVTAGLAHEVNQPLATIRLLADNGRAMIERDPQMVAKNLEQIAGMTERIDRITQQLRGFARKATGQLQPVAVKEVIEASVLLTASRRRVRGAKLVIHGANANLRVHAEAVRLEQVLVNLIQNAQEALHETKDPVITLTVNADEQHVRFEICDNGPGIAADMVGQVFMPFATSKSQGLGLGLVIARDIARDLGGELKLAPPVPGIGACFILRLNRA